MNASQTADPKCPNEIFGGPHCDGCNDPVAHFTVYGEENGQDLTFCQIVILIADHRIMRNSSLLFWNEDFPFESQVISEIVKRIEQLSGYPVVSESTSIAQLRANDLNISAKDFLQFMAGKLLWFTPGFVVDAKSGEKHHSKIQSNLRAAVATYTALGLATINLASKDQEILLNKEEADKYIENSLLDSLEYYENGYIYIKGFTKYDDIRSIPFAQNTTPYSTLKSAVEQGRLFIDQKKTVKIDQNLNALEADKLSYPAPKPHKKRTTIGLDHLQKAVGAGRTYTERLSDIQFDLLFLTKAEERAVNSPTTQSIIKWQQYIVAVLRTAASTCAWADTERQATSRRLRRHHKRYQELRLASPAEKNERSEQACLDKIENALRGFTEVDESSTGHDVALPHEALGLFNAVVVAFYTGVDPRHIHPTVGAGAAFDALLDSAIWCGRLRWERVRDLTLPAAIAIDEAAALMTGDRFDEDLLRECVSIISTAFEPNSWHQLVASAREVKTTRELRTVSFGPVSLDIASDQPSNLATAAHIDGLGLFGAMSSAGPRFGYYHNPDIARMLSTYRPLHLCGHFAAIPPAGWEESMGTAPSRR